MNKDLEKQMLTLEQTILALKNKYLHGVDLEQEITRIAVLEWLEELQKRRSGLEPKKVNVIIETTRDGKYCSSEIVQDSALANDVIERYKSSKQGYRHCYYMEEHYVG